MLRVRATFRSLSTRNYRLFATAQLCCSTGLWVQRIAQDWLVLTLTGSATAVGVTTALQFAPTLLFGLYGGVMADRYPKRRLLLATQLLMALMAAILALLSFTHQLRVWEIFCVAFSLGTLFAVDIPTRQSFVNELVPQAQLRNAISLNAAAFQLGALAGPAISGALLSMAGPGYAFTITAASYLVPTIAMARLRESGLYRAQQVLASGKGQLRAGLRYVADRPGILWITVLAGVFGMFTGNLPVTNAAFARSVFHIGAAGYGILSAFVAVGSLLGALLSATRMQPTLRFNVAAAAALAALYLLAGAVPWLAGYAVLSLAIGVSTMILITAANSTVQIRTAEQIRGRVMGVYLLVFIGGGAVGGPLIGLIDQALSPRIGMLTAGLTCAGVTALVALRLAAARRKVLAATEAGSLGGLAAGSGREQPGPRPARP